MQYPIRKHFTIHNECSEEMNIVARNVEWRNVIEVICKKSEWFEMLF